MNRLTLLAWLAAAAVAVTTLGALGTLAWHGLGTTGALLTVVLVAAVVAGSVLLGRQDAGPETPYW